MPFGNSLVILYSDSWLQWFSAAVSFCLTKVGVLSGKNGSVCLQSQQMSFIALTAEEARLFNLVSLSIAIAKQVATQKHPHNVVLVSTQDEVAHNYVLRNSLFSKSVNRLNGSTNQLNWLESAKLLKENLFHSHSHRVTELRLFQPLCSDLDLEKE